MATSVSPIAPATAATAIAAAGDPQAALLDPLRILTGLRSGDRQPVDAGNLLQQLRSHLKTTGRSFRSFFKSAQAEAGHLAVTRQAHAGVVTRSEQTMNWVAALNGVSLLAATARATRGNPEKFGRQVVALLAAPGPDKSAVLHAFNTFGTDGVAERMGHVLARHGISNAAALAQQAAGALGDADRGKLASLAPGMPLTAPNGSKPDGHTALRTLVDVLAPTLRKNPRDAARVVNALIDQAGTDGLSRQTIATLIESFTPDQLIDLLQKNLKPHLRFYASSSGAARLVYNRLVAIYMGGLEATNRTALEGHETALAGLRHDLEQGEPRTHADFRALADKVLGDATLNQSQRSALLDRIRALHASHSPEGSRDVRDAILAALKRVSLDPDLDPARQLEQIERARACLAEARDRLAAVRTAGSAPLLRHHALEIEKQIAQRDAELNAMVTQQLLALADQNPVLSRACAESRPVRDALLKCATLVFGQSAGLAGHLFNVLARKALLTADNVSDLVTGLVRGDIDACARLMGGPEFDAVRLVLLRATTPQGKGRDALIEARQKRLILERDLAPRFASDYVFPRHDLTTGDIDALRDAAQRAGTSLRGIDLLCADWVRQSLACVGADAGRAGVLLERLAGPVDLARMNRQIDQGLTSRTDVAKVEASMARLAKNVASNQAVTGLASVAATEAERNVLKQWLLIQGIAGVSRYETVAGRSTVVPLERARSDVHKSIASRAATLLPTEAEARAASRTLGSERSDVFGAARKELEGRIEAARQARDDNSALRTAKAEIVRIVADHGLRPAFADGLPVVPDALRTLVDEALRLDDLFKAQARAAVDNKGNAQGRAYDRQAAATRKQLAGVLETLRNWDPLTLQQRPRGTRSAAPQIGALHPIRNLAAQVGKVHQVAAQATARAEAVTRLENELAEMDKSRDDLAVAIDLQPRPDPTGKEAQHVRNLILLAASELCDEAEAESVEDRDPQRYSLERHREAILRRLQDRYGISQQRLAATAGRREAVASLFAGDVRLAAARDAFIAESRDLSAQAGAWMAADLRGAAQNLRDNEAFSFRIGTVGSLNLAIPGAATAAIGGLGLAVQARAADEDSVKVERVAIDGRMQYRVTVLGGKSKEVTAGLSAFFGTLTANLTGGARKLAGAALIMDDLAKVQDLIVRLAVPGTAAPGDWPMVDAVDLVSAEGRRFSVDLGATLPHPVKFFSGGAVDLDQMNATGSAGATLQVAGESEWATNVAAHRGTYERERRFSASASISVFGSTGIGALDAALSKAAAMVQDKTGIGSASAAASFAVRERSRLVTVDGALGTDSEIVLTAAASGAHRAQALAWVARTLNTRDQTVIARLGEWIEPHAVAPGEESFRMVLKPGAAAVTAYNIAMADADTADDPKEAARLRSAASLALRNAFQPARLERVRTTGATASAADGSIGNVLAARVLAATPVARRNEAEVRSDQVVERIDFDALQIATFVDPAGPQADAQTESRSGSTMAAGAA